ncbi:hypothetical protein O181_038689 [Austropuccinia psidii MF-1]|uniref:Chromo domain-containing protein n=1 Tax=Austropuccinia psidii MF-1 TaxID=1389203 RepID=A0A9Q3D8X4_9BASI|nr:hypothetical protein [Austropuccinia psidii MF-1]
MYRQKRTCSPTGKKSHSTRNSGGEESPGPVKKIIMARKVRLNGKVRRHYLVRLKSQTEDTDKWLAEDAIKYGNLPLRRFRASRRTE